MLEFKLITAMDTCCPALTPNGSIVCVLGGGEGSSISDERETRIHSTYSTADAMRRKDNHTKTLSPLSTVVATGKTAMVKLVPLTGSNNPLSSSADIASPKICLLI
mmetsp:Transcript_23253/g.39719  ORF Transcript_23253/g.39719 Transcript_23253/m.39719 type:complete len:106 (-) Transcript_23253:159-476(-)